MSLIETHPPSIRLEGNFLVWENREGTKVSAKVVDVCGVNDLSRSQTRIEVRTGESCKTIVHTVDAYYNTVVSLVGQGISEN